MSYYQQNLLKSSEINTLFSCGLKPSLEYFVSSYPYLVIFLMISWIFLFFISLSFFILFYSFCLSYSNFWLMLNEYSFGLNEIPKPFLDTVDSFLETVYFSFIFLYKLNLLVSLLSSFCFCFCNSLFYSIMIELKRFLLTID